MLCGAKKNRICWGGKAEIEDAAGNKTLLALSPRLVSNTQFD
jgi:hypothetical protein